MKEKLSIYEGMAWARFAAAVSPTIMQHNGTADKDTADKAAAYADQMIERWRERVVSQEHAPVMAE